MFLEASVLVTLASLIATTNAGTLSPCNTPATDLPALKLNRQDGNAIMVPYGGADVTLDKENWRISTNFPDGLKYLTLTDDGVSSYIPVQWTDNAASNIWSQSSYDGSILPSPMTFGWAMMEYAFCQQDDGTYSMYVPFDHGSGVTGPMPGPICADVVMCYRD